MLRQNAPLQNWKLCRLFFSHPPPPLSRLGLWEHCLLFFCFLIYYLKILSLHMTHLERCPFFYVLQFYCFFFTSSSQVLFSITAKLPSGISAFSLIACSNICFLPWVTFTVYFSSFPSSRTSLLAHRLMLISLGFSEMSTFLTLSSGLGCPSSLALSHLLACDSCVLSAGASSDSLTCIALRWCLSLPLCTPSLLETSNADLQTYCSSELQLRHFPRSLWILLGLFGILILTSFWLFLQR